MQIKTKIVSCHTADSKPVKQEVNGTVILPPIVFPGEYIAAYWHGPPALYLLSSYVSGHCLVVASQSGAKVTFYCTVYYTTLNSNCEAQRALKM